MESNLKIKGEVGIMDNRREVSHQYAKPEYVLENGDGGQAFDHYEILACIEGNDIERAKKMLRQNVLLSQILNTGLNWINHPEYVQIVSYDEGKATFRYRDHEYDLLVE